MAYASADVAPISDNASFRNTYACIAFDFAAYALISSATSLLAQSIEALAGDR